jgi:hypothetical protein
MSMAVWLALWFLLPFCLGGAVGFAVPWRLRWVAVLGLTFAGVFWIASVLSSTPDADGGGEGPIAFWIALAVLLTLIALTLYCAGAWLGKAGRKAYLASR